MDGRGIGGTRVTPGWIVAAGLVVVVLVAVGVPLGGLLYVGVLLLCPLMMVGMHGGHSRGRDSHGGPSDRDHRVDRHDAGVPREGGRT